MNKYGLLINNDIKLHRQWFKQFVKLHGINCIYKAPRKSSNFDQYGELDAKYYEPITVGCIFDEHPDQKSLKKIGWVAELQENSSIIHVPYDLEHLEEGALFTIPPGIDNAKWRTFRVISISNIMIYPATIACELAPEYESTDEKSLFNDFQNSTNTLLKDLEGDD